QTSSFIFAAEKLAPSGFCPEKGLPRYACAEFFFGSKIASANFSAALRKLEIEPYKIYRKKSEEFFFNKSDNFWQKDIDTLFYIL
ncbi:MAG: hypothetical protein II397_13465, partial [Treponema sp.]|nr:hypothetical protein [Treponema sp.]